MTSLFGKKNNSEEKEEKPVAAEGETNPPLLAKEEKPSAPQPAPSVKEIERFKKEAAEYKDKYVRLLAEFDNVRKRSEREKNEFVKYANEGLLGEFVNVLDDLERSIEAAKAKHQDYDAFLKGIEMVMAHIYEMLKKNNVHPIDSVGKKFDHNCHEALMQEELEDVEDNVITEELQKGYSYGDKILRTAKVKVAKKKENLNNDT